MKRVRGLGFIVWHARHMVYHVLIGIVWAWFLRERWSQFNPAWVTLSVVGALIPDAEHIYYFFGYGKRESYTRDMLALLKTKQWRKLTVFLEKGHKYNTHLSFHNMYTAGFFLVSAVAASRVDWRVGVILFGAISSHYLFDMFDDIMQLGALNSNWRRWGRPEKG